MRSFTAHVPLPEHELYGVRRVTADAPLLEDIPPAAGPEEFDLPADAERVETMPDAQQVVPLDFIAAPNWEGTEAPPREWLVHHRLPAGAVCLLQGDGAAGKTTIALQLLAATVLGKDWLGAVIHRQGPAMFLSAEEDNDEIHRRIERVARHLGVRLVDLEGLHLLGMPGEDAVLGLAGKDGVVRATPLFFRLEAAAKNIRPVLIVVEAAADVFAGNENDRNQVRQFIGLLRRLAIGSGATILLLAHPSLAGMASGTGTSGSTGWNNSVRSRLYFSAVRAKDEEGPELDLRQLQVMKSNYGPSGETVKLRWRDGVFVCDGAPASFEQIAAERAVDEAFLRCLDVRTAQGIMVSPAPTSHSFAPKMFEDMPQAARIRKRALQAAMERLLADGRIRVNTIGSRSKSKGVLARAIPESAQ